MQQYSWRHITVLNKKRLEDVEACTHVPSIRVYVRCTWSSHRILPNLLQPRPTNWPLFPLRFSPSFKNRLLVRFERYFFSCAEKWAIQVGIEWIRLSVLQFYQNWIEIHIFTFKSGCFQQNSRRTKFPFVFMIDIRSVARVRFQGRQTVEQGGPRRFFHTLYYSYLKDMKVLPWGQRRHCPSAPLHGYSRRGWYWWFFNPLCDLLWRKAEETRGGNLEVSHM